jgi:hypothetical protein
VRPTSLRLGVRIVSSEVEYEYKIEFSLMSHHISEEEITRGLEGEAMEQGDVQRLERSFDSFTYRHPGLELVADLTDGKKKDPPSLKLAWSCINVDSVSTSTASSSSNSATIATTIKPAPAVDASNISAAAGTSSRPALPFTSSSSAAIDLTESSDEGDDMADSVAAMLLSGTPSIGKDLDIKMNEVMETTASMFINEKFTPSAIQSLSPPLPTLNSHPRSHLDDIDPTPASNRSSEIHGEIQSENKGRKGKGKEKATEKMRPLLVVRKSGDDSDQEWDEEVESEMREAGPSTSTSRWRKLPQEVNRANQSFQFPETADPDPDPALMEAHRERMKEVIRRLGDDRDPAIMDVPYVDADGVEKILAVDLTMPDALRERRRRKPITVPKFEDPTRFAIHFHVSELHLFLPSKLTQANSSSNEIVKASLWS